MTLIAELTAEEYEALPDHDKAHYREHGDVYRAQIEERNGLKLTNPQSVLGDLQDERKKRRSLASRAIPEDLDLKPSDLPGILEELDTLRNARSDGEKKTADERQQAIADAVQQATDRLKGEAEDLRRQNGALHDKLSAQKRSVYDRDLKAAILEIIAQPEGEFAAVSPSILAKDIAGYFQPFEDDEGNLVAGLPRSDGREGYELVIEEDGRQRPKGPADLIPTLIKKQDYKAQFLANLKAGSGFRTDETTEPGGRASENPWVTGNLTQQMQIESTQPELAKRLEAEAQQFERERARA